MKAVLFRSLNVSLMVFLALLSGAVYWLLLTQPGIEWVARRVNDLDFGLRVEVESGSVLRELKLTQLVWRSPELIIKVEKLSAQWQLACLIKSELCIKKLTAKSLRIRLLEQSEAQHEIGEVSLAEISLPFPIAIEALVLDEFLWLDGEFSQQLELITASAEMTSTKLTIDSLSANYDELNVALNGKIDFVDHYSFVLAANIVEEALPLKLQLRLEGDLDKLGLTAQSQLPYPLRAVGEISALLSQPQFSLELKNIEPLKIAAGEQQALIGKASLNAKGGFDDIELKLDVIDFELEELSADMDLSAVWQNGILQIGELNINSSAGTVSGTGAVDIDTDERDGLAWDAALLVSSLDIAQVVNKIELVSHLSGNIKSKGYWKSEQLLNWSVSFADWQGHFMDQQVALSGALEQNHQGRLQVHELNVDVANNKFIADGSLNAEQPLHINMTLPVLHQLWPGLSGDLRGEINIHGDIAKPTLVGHISGSDFEYLNFQLQTLAVGFDIKALAESESDVIIRAEGANLGGTQVQQFSAVVKGSQQQHNIALEIDLPELGELAVNCDAGLAVSLEWQGECKTLSLSPAANELPAWRNENPLQFAWQAQQKSLQVQAFCLSASEGRLCSEKTISFGEQSLSGLTLKGKAIPVSWFAPVLSKELELSGESHWDLTLDWTSKNGLAGEMKFQADGTSGSWWLDETHQYPFLFDNLSSLIKLESDQLLMDLNYESSQLGRLSGKITVNDLAEKRQLDGKITISRFDIAPLAVLDDSLGELAGEINGDVTLGGSLSLPTLQGDVKLSDGKLVSRIVDARFDDIQLEIQFDREVANIDGRLDIDGSELAIKGDMQWPDEQLQSRLNLRGQSIPFSYDPIKQAKLSPDLDIELRHNYFGIKGIVGLEDVLIRMKRLPQNAYSESLDVQYVEQELAEDLDQQLRVAADLRMNLGDNVVFRGFGADVELVGHFRYLQNEGGYPRGEGEISIDEGHYTVWGQRLEIREGSFVFAGPIDSPDIKIEAIREIMTEDITVGMRGYGPIQEPTFEIFSEPAMGSDRAMHYLLTGRAPDAEASKGGDVFSAAALSAGLSGAEGRAGNIADRFGIENFQMSTAGSAEGTEVQLSGYINSDLFIRYGMGLFDRANTLTVRYRLRPQLFIESASGLDNAVDIIYSFEHD